MGAAKILVVWLLVAQPPPRTFQPDEFKQDLPRIINYAQLKGKSASVRNDDRYDQVPFDGNLDARLLQLLQHADEENELGQFLEQLRNNPKLFHVDPDQIANIRTEMRNPHLREILLDLVRKQKNNLLTKKDLEELQARLRSLAEHGLTNRDHAGIQLPAPDPTMEERFLQWTKDLLEDLDHSRAGDLLRDSPAWRSALEGLERMARGGDVNPDWLGRMPEGWRLPEGWTPRLGDLKGRLPQLPELPELPRWRFNPPNFGKFNLNFGSGPGVNVPAIGGASVNENVAWVLAPVLLSLLAWVFYRKMGRASAQMALGARRGPWPVDPAGVTTRTQLIQAFDYLALLLLGDEVRTWNHLAVAHKLGAKSAHSPAAAELAQLYELARYTPGADLLSADAQTAARRHLTHLAGSAAA